MNKKYRVVLTSEQRQTLESLIRTGSALAQTQTHARILLKADAAEDGAAWGDAAIAQACDVSVRQSSVCAGPASPTDSTQPCSANAGSARPVASLMGNRKPIWSP